MPSGRPQAEVRNHRPGENDFFHDGETRLRVAGTKTKQRQRNSMKYLIQRILGKVQVHASLADIKGSKSGGMRDDSGIDWKQLNGNQN